MTEIPEHLLKRAAAARERAAASNEQNNSNAELDLSLENEYNSDNTENSELKGYIDDRLRYHEKLVHDALSPLQEIANISDAKDEDFWIVDSRKDKNKKTIYL